MKIPTRMVIVGALAAALMLAGCSPAQTETERPEAQPSTATPEPPTPLPATETSAPTATPPPTETPAPSPTPMLAVRENGFSVWCLPPGFAPLPNQWQQPEFAQVSTLSQGITTVPSQMQSCTYVYQLNQPAPPELELWVYDANPQPFWKTAMSTAADSPNVVYAYLTHPFIVSPPYWEIEYRFELRLPEDKVVEKDTVVIKRNWIGYGVCYGGVLPDPVTLKCPALPEAHPWHPWYGWDDPR